MNKNASAFILDKLEICFNPLFQNAPKIIALPNYNILTMIFFLVTVHWFYSHLIYICGLCIYLHALPRFLTDLH